MHLKIALLRRWPALRHPGLGRFMLVRLAAEFAVQIQTVSVGWAVYDRTHDPLDLGLIGLSQFLPALALILLTGSIADRFPRNRIVGACLAVNAACALALIAILTRPDAPVWLVFLVMSVFGISRAFYNPAQQALLATLVPARRLASAIAMNTTGSRIAQIAGPVAGGLLYQSSVALALSVGIALLLFAATIALRIPASVHAGFITGTSGLLDGFRYVWGQKIVLGAVSFDMFAVLLGSATALMPIFAQDILNVGPVGLGLLYASSSAGALIVAFSLSLLPIRKHAGRIMFAAVALFGAATIIFGASRSLELSLLALFVMGAADMVSVNLRHTLVQIWTPEALRGRVSAINSVSIGASNEIGQFRGGLVSSLIGAGPAVIVGGVGTLAIVALWMRLFPDLLAVQRLDRKA